MGSCSKFVAVITGGASGIGLAVAKALVSSDKWSVCLFDQDKTRGQAAQNELGPEATFHHADVTDYASLSAAFKEAFEMHHKLNLVFANAGIVSAENFYELGASVDTVPREPSRKVLEIDLYGVVATSLLAQHYLRRSKTVVGEPKDIVVTASAGGFYQVTYDPLYCAAKHGVVGFVRSIAGKSFASDKIRVNAICPGIVRTNILPDQVFEAFPESTLTPTTKIADVLMMLVDGKDGEYVGQTVEVFREKHWFRKQVDFCAPEMAALMGTADAL